MHIILEQFRKIVPSDDLPGDEAYEFSVDYIGSSIELIKTHGDSEQVSFDPPLHIEATLKGDLIHVYYDFGLSFDLPTDFESYGTRPETPWTERLKRLIEYDLDHTFFHSHVDPNYYVMRHYALLGCLCLRQRAKLTQMRVKEAAGSHQLILDTVPIDWVP